MNKKILVVLCLFMFLFVLSSCNEKPKLDFNKAKENLEDEGYLITYVDNSEFLEINEKKSLYGYVDEEYGYVDEEFIIITEFRDLKSARLFLKYLESEYDKTTESLKAELNMYKHTLNKYDKELTSEEMDDLKEEIRELEEELEEYEEDYKCGRSGKIVWYGTEDAIEATK